jgi:TetR/AcrR family transcriptional regulator, transcriptional repressor for nem operon
VRLDGGDELGWLTWTHRSTAHYAVGVGVSVVKTAKGRATRERIVAATADLMIERGVAATSLDDVRARARVSKGQLYHYFTDKDDLVDAVIAHTVDDVLASQPQLADLSSWSAISAWFDDLVAFRVALKGRGGCPIGGLASELADQREKARLELAEAYARWEEPLRRGLETMRGRGELDAAADPGRLATATMAAIQGGLLLTKTRRDPEQMRIALDAAYAHLRSFAVA